MLFQFESRWFFGLEGLIIRVEEIKIFLGKILVGYVMIGSTKLTLMCVSSFRFIELDYPIVLGITQSYIFEFHQLPLYSE